MRFLFSVDRWERRAVFEGTLLEVGGNVTQEAELVFGAQWQGMFRENDLQPGGKEVLSDKVNLDIFWLKDKSLQDLENLPDPDVLAADIVENVEAAPEQFSSIYEDLQGD